MGTMFPSLISFKVNPKQEDNTKEPMHWIPLDIVTRIRMTCIGTNPNNTLSPHSIYMKTPIRFI